jgi:MoaA/NifB/PqqE/SkfB family radical SAM enzyme
MKCKFLQNGIAIGYDHIVKPCCTWLVTPEYAETNHLSRVDLSTWHDSPALVDARHQLAQDQWPAACANCERVESQGRQDSIRGGGASAYGHYDQQDITLEIRPGNVCNFACQTCWPAASTRVAEYHGRAGLIDIKSVDSTSLDDYDFLLPIADRIRDVVVLGGEPFYDRSCRKFLAWAQENLTANLLIFTNGSAVDFEFLANYRGVVTLVFSLDAVGRPAEYIRYGTEWDKVKSNYLRARTLPNVRVRVNITVSVYNYLYLEELVNFLTPDWPSVVTFGTAYQPYLKEVSVPDVARPAIVNSLTRTVEHLRLADIESGQKSNAVNAVTATINNLLDLPHDPDALCQLTSFVHSMDQVKHISILDYCPELTFIK